MRLKNFLIIYLFLISIGVVNATQIYFTYDHGNGEWLNTSLSNLTSAYNTEEAYAFHNGSFLGDIQELTIFDDRKVTTSLGTWGKARTKITINSYDVFIEIRKDKAFGIYTYYVHFENQKTGDIFDWEDLFSTDPNQHFELKFILIDNTTGNKKYGIELKIYDENGNLKDIAKKNISDPFGNSPNFYIRTWKEISDVPLKDDYVQVYVNLTMFITEGNIPQGFEYVEPSHWWDNIIKSLGNGFSSLSKTIVSTSQDLKEGIVNGLTVAKEVFLGHIPSGFTDFFGSLKDLLAALWDSGLIILSFFASNLINLIIILLLISVLMVASGEMSVVEFLEKLLNIYRNLLLLIIKIIRTIRELIPFI